MSDKGAESPRPYLNRNQEVNKMVSAGDEMVDVGDEMIYVDDPRIKK